MTKILTIFENISIKLKITLGLSVLLLFFVIQSFVSLKSLKKIDLSFGNLSEITRETVGILEFDRDILDLEKRIFLYSTYGRESIYNQIVEKFNVIDNQLQKTLSETDDNVNRKTIVQMLDIIKTFGENIPVLKKHYTYREKLFNEELPLIFNKGNRLFRKILEDKNLSNRIKTTAQNDILIWSEINMDTGNFLKTKKFKLRKSVYKKLDILLNNEKYYLNYEVEKVIQDYRNLFGRLIQANRIFLSLVNVVITGDSVEFSTLANQVKVRKLDKLKKLSQSNNEAVDLSINFAQVLSISFLLLVLLIGWFYNTLVFKGLNSISKTFNKLLKGDFNTDIPGVERNDEIGQLARVAQEFNNLNNELRVAKDIAEKSERTQAAFLANMSHEIRTPMNGILGMVSIMGESIRNEEEAKYLKIIESCGDSLLTILNDILDISKFESGKLELEKRRFNLSECIKDGISLLDNKASEKGIIIKFNEVESSIINLEGDVTRIRQILVNYLSNAIKFSDKGEIVVNVKLNEKDSINQSFTITVSDNGIGVNEDIAELLFSPFTQADSSITRKFGGTGLGLSICKKLAEVMGGSVFVESNNGQGATFGLNLTLPIADAEDGENCSIEVKDTDLKNISKNHPHTILIAEDNIVNQKIIRITLEKIGYECDIVENGEEAVQAVSKKKYSIVFMDMQMPVKSGIEATNEIVELQGEDRPAIIALTANVYVEDKEKCFESGMVDFITKPMKKKELVRILMKHSA